ncbi:alkaline phosphatase D family protein [Zobellia sp.]|nr:alkaline phosphatase D family protein [Zobellia sp.]
MRLALTLLLFGFTSLFAQDDTAVYFATGFKIGEVTDSSAIVHVRLCKSAKPVAVYHQQKDIVFRPPIDFDDSMPIAKMEGAVAGSSGQVKFILSASDTVIHTDWTYVSGYKDFTLKHYFKGLSPNTKYQLRIEGRKKANAPVAHIEGKFMTAPSEEIPIPLLFTVSTCQYYWSHDDAIRGFKIYDNMLKLDPAFHCQTGDYIYYDKPGPKATNVALARHKWHAMNSWPSLVDFYSNIPVYLQKDDHDLLKDDATPYSPPFGNLSYGDGLDIWREQVPIIDKPYRTFRWGKDVQIWSVEGREYRSDNKAPDGKDKTIWGKEQIAWFKKTLEASDATFKILISPTPVVGPDRSKGKIDNYSNAAYATEGTWLRDYLAEQNVFVINGDRHWQYVSVDQKTGLWEFSSGPVSNYHAQGWDPNDVRPEHKFLRVAGGFLTVKVHREQKQAVIEFTHYDVDGNVVHQEAVKKPI